MMVMTLIISSEYIYLESPIHLKNEIFFIELFFNGMLCLYLNKTEYFFIFHCCLLIFLFLLNFSPYSYHYYYLPTAFWRKNRLPASLFKMNIISLFVHRSHPLDSCTLLQMAISLYFFFNVPILYSFSLNQRFTSLHITFSTNMTPFPSSHNALIFLPSYITSFATIVYRFKLNRIRFFIMRSI